MDVLGEAWVKIAPLLDGSFEGDLESKVGAAAGAAGESGSKMLTEKLTPAATAIAVATGAIAESYQAAKASIVEATGASGEALEELLDITQNVAQSGVSTSLGEIGEVVGQISQRLKDLSPVQVEALTEQIVKLAEITGGDASDSVANITDLFEKWNVPTAQQAGLLDRLFAASQRAGIPMDTLISLLAANAGPLQRFGFSMEQVVGVITQIEQAGGDATPVLAALNTAFAKLAGEGLEPVETLEELSKSIRGAKTDAAAMEIGVETLGARSAKTLVPAIRSGTLSAKDFSGALDAGLGSIDRTHEATRSLGDRVRQLGNFLGAAIGPFAQYASIAATIVAGIGPLAQGIGAVVGPLRQQQAAAALAGESLSLAEAAGQRYGPTAKKAAIGAGVFGAALIGLGIVSSQHEKQQQRIADVADEVSQALLDGTFSLERFMETTKGADALGLIEGVNAAKDAVYDQVAALKVQGGALSATEQAAFDAAFAEGSYAKALNIVKGAQQETTATGKDLTQTHKQQAAAARDLRLAELGLVGGLTGIAAASASLTSAQTDLTAAERKLANMLERGKRGSKAYADQQGVVDAAVLSVLQSQNSLTGSVLEHIDALKGTNGEINSMKEVVALTRQQGEAAGLTGEQIQALIGNVQDAIRENKDFGQSAETGGRQARDAYGSVGRTAGEVAARIGAAGQSGGSRFAGASRAGASSARSAYAGIPGALSSLPGAFGSLGARAAASFASGLSGIVSRAGAIAAAAANAARSALRVGSPSRVFMELGENSREGFMASFGRLPDDVGVTMDRTLSRLRAGEAAGTFASAPPALARAAGGEDFDEALIRVAQRMGGLAPTIIQGDVVDYFEAVGKADEARKRRGVFLGGRRFP